MILRSPKRGVVALAWVALVAGVTASTAIRNASADSPAPPSWANETLGNVNYSYLGDQRKKDEQIDFRINEEGLITGQDVLNQPEQDAMASAIYEHMLEAHPEQIDPKKSAEQLRLEYRGKMDDLHMATLILNRIVDHEAMKHKLPPNVPDARVDYVMRSILIQFGANSGHLAAHNLPPKTAYVFDAPGSSTCHVVQVKNHLGNPVVEKTLDEDPSTRSNEEMYGWLKNAVGTNQLSFDMDWTYADRGMAFDHDHLHDSPDIGWPMEIKIDSGTHQPVLDSNCQLIQQEQKVSMSFDRMPATWQEFRETIRAQLQGTYRSYMRLSVWKALVMERNPLLSWESMFSATPDQMNQMYLGLKNNSVIRSSRDTAIFSEVSASGAKAPEFKKRYLDLLDAGEKAHENDFNNVDASVAFSEEGRATWIAKVAALRRKIQGDAYRQAVAAPEFATEIISGKLHISTTDRSLTHAAEDQLPTGTAFKEQEEQAAFNSGFFTQRLLPRMSGVDSDNSIKIMTMIDYRQDPVYKSKNDPAVRNLLKQQVENRIKGKAFRRLAFELFKLNPFRFSYNFCRDEAWPCSYADDQRVAPRLLAEALFPETLYPGQELPSMLTRGDGHGNLVSVQNSPKISSTLNHDEYFGRVQDIAVGNMERVFGAPDDHVDSDIIFHNY